MLIQIESRFSPEVLFETDAESLKLAVEKAVELGANLRYADLRDADLKYANLRDANLRYADLRYANLRYADLRDAELKYADLRYANLRDANLRCADLRCANLGHANLRCANLGHANLRDANLGHANLRDADLRDADLGHANLRDANLRCANLRCANLRDANLGHADLTDTKEDYLNVLSVAKNEVTAFYKSLLDGKIDGSTYSGPCACLVGTIANIRGEDYESLGIDLRPDSSRPAERWFLNIRQGDTPQNNPISAITAEWTEEFMRENDIAVPTRKVVQE